VSLRMGTGLPGVYLYGLTGGYQAGTRTLNFIAHFNENDELFIALEQTGGDRRLYSGTWCGYCIRKDLT
jgi:hypothetical protein